MTQNYHAEAVQVLLKAASLAGVHMKITRGCTAPEKSDSCANSPCAALLDGDFVVSPTEAAAALVVEVSCSLLLGLRRSALWAVVAAERCYAELVTRLLKVPIAARLPCPARILRPLPWLPWKFAGGAVACEDQVAGARRAAT